MPNHRKRSDQRRRRNADESGLTLITGAGADNVEVPEADPAWESLAADWYRSLAESGQARYFEPSDWQAARLIAWQMSKLIGDAVGNGQPIRASAFDGLWSAMGDMLTSEGSRRKVRVELQRSGGVDPVSAETRSTMEAYTDILSG